VRATLHSHRRPPLSVPGALVPAAAATTPELALSVRVVPHGDRTGPHGHPVQRAEISLTNHGPSPLHGLEVVLGYPDDERIELLDRGARLPLLSPGATQRVDLALEVSPTITGDLPLEVQVEADRFGRLLTWSTPTPIDGSPSTWRAPRIDVQRPSRPGAPGPTVVPVRVRDDGELEHVELWLNYRKVSWFQGRGVDMRVEPSLTLEPGHNLLTVVARDRSGLVTHRVVQLRTEEPSAADAE
jgi:hypothetical protein